MNSSRRKPQNPEVRRILGLPPENEQDVDEGAVDADEKTAANSKERFEQIYQAVRHGAFDHDLEMSNNTMFLCERIVELEAQAAATGKRAAVYLQNAADLQARVEELEYERDELAAFNQTLMHANDRHLFRETAALARVAELEASLHLANTDNASLLTRAEAAEGRSWSDASLDVAAYLLDRADQYDLDGGFWVALADCAKAIVSGAVDAAKAHGELDASLYERLATMNDDY